MQAYQLLRQLDLIPIEKLAEEITVIGAGAIGSFTALALCKMGFGNVRVIDPDLISHENMNCQFYPLDSVGLRKVEALKHLIEQFTGFSITAEVRKYEGGAFSGIVIASVDNMMTRRLIWEEHVRLGTLTRRVIDPRMAIESGLLYCMDPKSAADKEAYAKTLYKDEDAIAESCTAKAVMYTPLILSGLIAKTVKDLVMGDNYIRTSNLAIKENQLQLWPTSRR